MESTTYSVKAASRLSGVTPSTLRAWERRHSAIAPGRDGSGRRIYTTEDVDRLSLLHRATALGQPISAIAGLKTAELRKLCAPDPDRAADDLARDLVAALQAYDGGNCEKILNRALASLDPVELAQNVLEPALREVGEQWAVGKMSIAQERILSASIERLLQSSISACRWGTAGPGIVFATLSGEQHGLGTLMAALIAASRGYRSRYLGANLPAAEIARAAAAMGCGIVAVGMTNNERPHARLEQLAQLCQAFDGPVWLGGGAAQDIRDTTLPGNCALIASESEYLDRLRMVNAGH